MHLTPIKDLSKIIHRSVASIYSDLARNPGSLPPRLQIPGTRKVLFIDVDVWLTNLSNQAEQPENKVDQKPIRGRRSTKKTL